MKKYLIKTFSFLSIMLATLPIMHAQSAQMSASNSNGQINILVKNAAAFNQFFLLESNDSIMLSFYLRDDDPRNGKHRAKPTTLANGQISMVFSTLNVQQSDDFTFYALENLAGGVLNDYIFINGAYQGTASTTTNTSVCPISISCNGSGLAFTFAPDELLVGQQWLLQPIVIFAPGFESNGTQIINGLSTTQNSLRIRSGVGTPSQCSKIMNGTAILYFQGKKCVFNNGSLVSNNQPLSSYYNSSACASIFEDCGVELIKVLEAPAVKTCSDWMPNLAGTCGTATSIRRSMPVAIGIDKCPSGYLLAVQNGIITDRLKLCKTQWCDYVFEPDYRLMPLSEVKTFIRTKRHLPGFPSGTSIATEKGFDLGDITFHQQEKIEELVRYLIEEEEAISNMELLLSWLEMNERLRTH